MAWNLGRSYIERHLSDYVKFQLKQGYELSDIRKTLVRYGYSAALVESVCKGINPSDYATASPIKREVKGLNQDLYLYLQNLLVDYIKREQSQGYSIEVIKKALIKYGHHPAMVGHAIRAVEQGQVDDTHAPAGAGLPAGLLLAFALLATFAGIFMLAMLTDSELNIVTLGFFPSILSILLVYAIVAARPGRTARQLLPVASIAFTVLAFVAMLRLSSLLHGLSEPNTVLLLNAAAAFVLASLLSFFSGAKPRRLSVKEIESAVEQEQQVKASDAAKHHS